MSKRSLSEVDVVISLEESFVSQLSELSEKLSGIGLKNVKQLENIGIITGRCNPKTLEKIRSVPGISAVETSGRVQISPPETELQ